MDKILNEFWIVIGFSKIIIFGCYTKLLSAHKQEIWLQKHYYVIVLFSIPSFEGLVSKSCSLKRNDMNKTVNRLYILWKG